MPPAPFYESKDFDMELNEKLQELRKQKGLTQEELAERLYVSRTAVSKWESGRGYPNIESLKAIARFFSITVDQLLSADQALTLAQSEQKQARRHFCDLVIALLDACALMLLFLPLFVAREEGTLSVIALLSATDLRLYLRITYLLFVIVITLTGILSLALQGDQVPFWGKYKTALSLGLGACAVILFIISLQPYAASFVFVLLAIKVFLLFKRQ